MFKASPQAQHIPSKSQAIKPEVISDVVPNDQIRITLPSFLGFVDPTQTFLRADIQLSGGRGVIVPDPVGGAHSLFRNIVIRDGSGTTTLESIDDYNAMVGMVRPYTEFSSVGHKRQLFEGVQPTPTQLASLYYGAADSLDGTSSSAPSTVDRVKNKPEVYLQLDTGLFKGSQVLPIAAMDGMRLTIDTEDPERAMLLLSVDGTETSNTAVAGAPVAPVPDKSIGDDVRTGSVNSFSMDTTLAVADDQAENPFFIGDRLYIGNPTNHATTEELLGTITGFYKTAGGNLGVVYVPNRIKGSGLTKAHTAATSVLYVKKADRVSEATVFGPDDLNSDIPSLKLSSPSYVLKDVEMLCQSVQPPKSYVDGLLKKSLTESGVSMDILTPELHRVNSNSTGGIVQVQIPTLAKRAKSVLVQPVKVADYRDATVSSFSGIPDLARDYQFQFGTELVPTRKAALQRYSQTPARPEPLHMTELQKALINIGRPVTSLQKIEEFFAIGRAFNRYGQITDVSDETISLRVDYDSGASQKVFNSYVFRLARITIAKGMVSVIA